MAFETILFEKIGHIAKITLNRPEAMNAVNSKLWLEVGQALKEFNEDADLWVGIVTGAGDRVFCAGADLKEIMMTGGLNVSPEAMEWGFAGITANYVGKPLIAAVNGAALGGGTEIAMACDLIVASEKAKFGLPEVARGIVAGGGGLLRLPRQIPLKVAMNLILTGEAITAEEAKSWGLVNQVVPHDQVMDAAMALAQKICDNAPLAVAASKEIVYRGLEVPMTFPKKAWEISYEYGNKVMASDDAKEGPRAFAEKRKPNWQGR